MRKVTIKWLGNCPQCLSQKLSAITKSPSNNHFFSGEAAICDKCGTEGIIKVDPINRNYIDWGKRFKPTPSETEAMAAKMRDLVNNTNLDACLFSLSVAKSRSSGENYECLGNVETIIRMIKEAKDKGVL